MQKILTAAVLVTLGTALTAQTTFTTPPGYLTKDAGYYNPGYHVYYRDGQMQLTETSAKTAAILTALDFRSTTYYPPATFRGMGRTFSSVTLKLGETNAAKMTSVFTQNWIGSATTVWSGKLSLPSYTTGSTPKQVWGNRGTFTLSKAYAFSGKNDLLQEWMTMNGVLANGYTGSGSSYYVDGGRTPPTSIYSSPSSSSTSANRYLPRYPFSVTNACNDSAITTTTTDSYARFAFYVYGDTYSVSSYRGKMRIGSAYTYRSAPGKAIITALTVGGSDAGLTFPGSCNKLHVNMGFPLAIVAKTAGTSSSAYTTGWFPTTALVPYSSAFKGATIYWQGAWDDSKTGAFSLTNATRLVVPAKPVAGTFPSEKRLYRYKLSGTWRPSNTDASYGYGPYASTFYNPIERWTRK